MAGKYRLTTLGCKVNQYESEQVRELLESLGLRPAVDGECADVAVVNTCCWKSSSCRETPGRGRAVLMSVTATCTVWSVPCLAINPMSETRMLRASLILCLGLAYR